MRTWDLMKTNQTSWRREKSVLTLLEISKATLYRWRIRGTIQSRRVGHARYYNVTEFLERLEDGDIE